MTNSAKTLEVVQTVIVPWDDVVYLCGLGATLLALVTVTD